MRSELAEGAASPALAGQVFIGRFGHVQYYEVAKVGADWRASYAGTAVCEFDGCGKGGGYGSVVFDHCHRHGWVRGVLCGSHNVRLGHIESVMSIEGALVDLGSTPFGEFLARCPDCPDGDRDVARWRPARGPFAPEPPRLPNRLARLAARRFPADPGPPVAHPRGKVAHLVLDGQRTFCGLVTDAMTVAGEAVPACRGCWRTAGWVKRETGRLTEFDQRMLARHAAAVAARLA